MPAKGQSQSNETKKKISDALKKDGGAENVSTTMPKSPEARALYSEYQTSKNETIKLRNKRDALADAKKALGRKKGSAAKRKEIEKQVKALNAELKAQEESRKDIRKRANEARRVKKAEERINKANARISKIADIKSKIESLLGALKARKITGKNSEEKQKAHNDRIKSFEDRLSRLDTLKNKQDELIISNQDVVKNKGKSDNDAFGSFNFDEQICNDRFLDTKKYKPFRDLTACEKRIDFEFLNDQFEDLEAKLKADMDEATAFYVQDYTDRTKKKVDDQDIAGIAALLFPLLFINSIRKTVRDTMSKAYDIGKKIAAKELKIGETPPSTDISNKLRGVQSSEIAQYFVSDLERAAKSTVISGVAVGANPGAIAVRTLEEMMNRASAIISNIKGSVVGQSMNYGRRDVFESNITKITKFQRSELLDGKTCNICLSLDKRVVPAGDRMVALDLVHSNCRGIWIPIFAYEEEQPELRPIPKSVIDTFDKIGDTPVLNSFKQLKKPVNKSNTEVQKELRKRAGKE